MKTSDMPSIVSTIKRDFISKLFSFIYARDRRNRGAKLAKELLKGERGYKSIRKILEHLDDMESIFVLLNRDEKVAYINIAGCEALEAKYNQVIGKN